MGKELLHTLTFVPFELQTDSVRLESGTDHFTLQTVHLLSEFDVLRSSLIVDSDLRTRDKRSLTFPSFTREVLKQPAFFFEFRNVFVYTILIGDDD